jgi:hypothetical protein
MSTATFICYGLAAIAVFMFWLTMSAKLEQITMSRKQGDDNGDQTTSAPVSA